MPSTWFPDRNKNEPPKSKRKPGYPKGIYLIRPHLTAAEAEEHYRSIYCMKCGEAYDFGNREKPVCRICDPRLRALDKANSKGRSLGYWKAWKSGKPIA